METEDLGNAGDASLVLGVARRRQAALAEAYRRHAGAVFALARRVLGDATLAEDVVQEVFLGLWNAPERFDPARGSLRAYLLAQSHGRSVDVVRSEASRRRREEREARLRESPGYDIEQEIWDSVEGDQVRHALALLPEDERKAIELAYLGGRTYREVALLLEQPEGTVKSRIRAGLRRMRDRLKGVGIGVTWES